MVQGDSSFPATRRNVFGMSVSENLMSAVLVKLGRHDRGARVISGVTSYRLYDKLRSLQSRTACKLQRTDTKIPSAVPVGRVIKCDKLYKSYLAAALLGMQLAVPAILPISISRRFLPVPLSLSSAPLFPLTNDSR